MSSSQSTPIHKRNKWMCVCACVCEMYCAIKEASHSSDWQLMVHEAGEPQGGSLGARGENEWLCMSVASSWGTHECLCFKCVYIYSHYASMCMRSYGRSCVLLADKHAPRRKPLGGFPCASAQAAAAAETTTATKSRQGGRRRKQPLPICSFSQQLKKSQSFQSITM